jgi:hypothetical protein
LPTSTTVSIVFSLLGGAVCLGTYKLVSGDADGSLCNLIRKAAEIITQVYCYL